MNNIAREELAAMAARLSRSASLAGLLAAGFDAFEAIRAWCRACELSEPGLLAAFMMAAGAAVEGRNALAAAPSFLPGGARNVGGAVAGAPGADVGEAADALAVLAGLLADGMSAAAAGTGDPADRVSCAAAADAARQISHLLAGPAR